MLGMGAYLLPLLPPSCICSSSYSYRNNRNRNKDRNSNSKIRCWGCSTRSRIILKEFSVSISISSDACNTANNNKHGRRSTRIWALGGADVKSDFDLENQKQQKKNNNKKNNNAKTGHELEVHSHSKGNSNIDMNSNTFPKRWLIVLLCFSAFLLCNMDRVNMSIAILPMSAEYSWSPATVGLIQSSFFWGYLLTQVLSSSSIS